MSKFKIGDRVIVDFDPKDNYGMMSHFHQGPGVIKFTYFSEYGGSEENKSKYGIKFDDGHQSSWYQDWNLKPYNSYKIRERLGIK